MSDLEIKQIRKNLKISQTELAKMLGVSLRTIQNWEAGETIPNTKHEILRNLLSNEQVNEISKINISINKTENISNDLSDIDLLKKENTLIKNEVSVYKELAEARLEVIEGLRFKIASLEQTITAKEQKIAELKYTQEQSFLYPNVAEPAPELTGKKTK